MSFKYITYDVEDEVARLTLNRPEVSNGFNIPICEEILSALDMAANDEAAVSYTHLTLPTKA